MSFAVVFQMGRGETFSGGFHGLPESKKLAELPYPHLLLRAASLKHDA
jgi:hypothetical protein